MADGKRQTTITLNNLVVNRFLIVEYFPFNSFFYKSANSLSVVVSGVFNFTAKLLMALIVQMAAKFVCNILNLKYIWNEHK